MKNTPPAATMVSVAYDLVKWMVRHDYLGFGILVTLPKVCNMGGTLMFGHPFQWCTEVQSVSFVGYTGGEGGSPRLWNLQNLHAVPPYGYWPGWHLVDHSTRSQVASSSWEPLGWLAVWCYNTVHQKP